MSRQIYTYTDLTKITSSKNFMELVKYPQITVSADLRKSLTGTMAFDRVQGLLSEVNGVRVTEFHTFAQAIYEEWNSDQSKFNEMIILSELMREKLEKAEKGSENRNWLTGCMRNIDSILSSVILLEQADVKADDLEPNGDRNLELLQEAWELLLEKDPVMADYKNRMDRMSVKEAWKPVFEKAFGIESLSGIASLVFHGFYYITPYQEKIMKLLEAAGFQLIFLIQYDERYPYVYEIWDDTYSELKGYPAKKDWHIEKSAEEDPYGEIFAGKTAEISNRLQIKEYASIMEFVDDVKHIREKGFSLYSSEYKTANQVLRDYFPEEYGDRKVLSYPIGQFISTLNKMWDEDLNTIALDEDSLIECFSSGWLAVDGVSGKQYMQELMYVLPFFNGCHTIEEWEKRIELFKEIEKNVIAPFEVDLDADISVARWQEAIGSPFKNFSMFSVSTDKLEIILKLINQILEMAQELFGKKSLIRVHEHIRTLDHILKKNEISTELYSDERALVSVIFEKLNTDNGFDMLCHPADIARALDLFMSGRYDEGELQTNRVGLIYPLYFVDAACVKNRSKVHLCMSDVESLPGKNKDYVWPLTEKKIKEIYAKTSNDLLENLMQIMGVNTLCNRYFTYCALKNKDVTISWISTMGEKMLAPSPYIKLLIEKAGVRISPAARNAITYNRVTESPIGAGKIEKYDEESAPVGMIKEARMDYALCPMKYVLGYVVDKYPTFQSEFQTTYALNAFISAIYNLMKDKGMKVDEAYKAVVVLFPNMRKVEKRQVYDYIEYDRKENDMDYGNRTECGGKYYTDERLKIHYPNQDVREEAIIKFAKLNTPDRRRGLDLYEELEVREACTFCQHVSYCRNAIYAGDQENYYD